MPRPIKGGKRVNYKTQSYLQNLGRLLRLYLLCLVETVANKLWRTTRLPHDNNHKLVGWLDRTWLASLLNRRRKKARYGKSHIRANHGHKKKPYQLDKAYCYNSISIFLNSESFKNKSIAVLYFVAAITSERFCLW